MLKSVTNIGIIYLVIQRNDPGGRTNQIFPSKRWRLHLRQKEETSSSVKVPACQHLERHSNYSSRIFFGGNNNDCGSCCYNNGYSNGFNNGNSNNYNQGNYNQGNYNQGNYNQGNYNQGSFNSGGCQCDYSLTFQVYGQKIKEEEKTESLLSG